MKFLHFDELEFTNKNDFMEEFNLHKATFVAYQDLDLIEHRVLMSLDSIESSHMYILSNKHKYKGYQLSYIREYLIKIHDLLNNDYFIIPSSIHEAIIIPKTQNLNMNELTNIKIMIDQTIEPNDISHDPIRCINNLLLQKAWR